MGEGRLDKARREGRAKAICSACSVRKDCLDYAVATHEPHGVWGGLNELERRPLWRD
jgi:WhiB family transcriptional regulator, redox-sensing transcriptional regulator